MDASSLLDLHDAITRKREIEALLVFNTLESDQAEMKQELRNLNRRIRKLQDAVSGAYPTDYVDCRDVGHQWFKVSEDFDDADNLGRTLTCQRCSTGRFDLIDSTGDLIRRRYTHPQGYLLESMGGVYSKSFWRGLTYLAAHR